MNIFRHSQNCITSLLWILASFAATTGHLQNDAKEIKDVLDEMRSLASKNGKVSTRITNVEETVKSEMRRLSHRMDTAMEKIDNMGQKFEKILLMSMEEAGNRTIDAFRQHQQLQESQGPSCRRVISPEHPQNCEEIQFLGHKSSGVYRVYPREYPNGKDVYCDLVTAGGGWTVIQRRKESLMTQEDFYRTWDEYASGFGNLNDSHWIGLNVIAALTRAEVSKLRIEMTDWEGESRVASYGHFRIANASDLYRMNVSDYYGDAGDSLTNHNGMAFSTKDRDHDMAKGHCAQSYKGAWWYNKCYRSNLNGVYLVENDATLNSTHDGIEWRSWHKEDYSLKRTEMKIRSRHFQP